LYGLLTDVVSAAPAKQSASDLRVALADSKVLYSPQRGLGLLERGVLALVGAVGPCPLDWRELWLRLAPSAADELSVAPWHLEHECPLPLVADADDLACASHGLAEGMAAAGVRLAGLRSRAVFPAEFNRLVRSEGGKAEALSRVSIGLAAKMLSALGAVPAEIVCDKHGGRNRYGPLLQREFPDVLIEIHGERRAESVYRFGPDERRVEVRFRCRGEELLPVAAASMISKYLRELSMRAFNAFWQARVPELAPTAGYPGDARRFKRRIAAAQRALGIKDRVLWRSR
jgi:hypothetical protein